MFSNRRHLSTSSLSSSGNTPLTHSARASLLVLVKRTFIGIDLAILVLPSVIFAIWSSILLYNTVKVDNAVLSKLQNYTSDPFIIVEPSTNGSVSGSTSSSSSSSSSIFMTWSSSPFHSSESSFNNSTHNTSNNSYYTPLIFQCMVFTILFALTLADWINVLFTSFGGEICERLALDRWKRKKLSENPSLIFSQSHEERVEDGAADAQIPPMNEHWMDDEDKSEMAQTTCISHVGYLIFKWFIVGGVILGLFSWFTVELVAMNHTLRSHELISRNNLTTITSSHVFSSSHAVSTTAHGNSWNEIPSQMNSVEMGSSLNLWLNVSNSANLTSNTVACALLFLTDIGPQQQNGKIVLQQSKISSLGDSVFLYMVIRWMVYGLGLLLSIVASIIISVFGCCVCAGDKNSRRRSSNKSVSDNVTYRPLATVSDDDDE
ncbi:hypothetical protein C9374_007286 [Naegleria lovaniensis]|uniref:Uncharacterized protein n=1 Tax=Naegleria lovaniensis TaxID=51637 RepID=A0AA88GZD5_NAELO|nr:uncharacterized protein C9374_007286 [Naegleria lovaniensis]KAG2393755.1 hypothetical protein C9374_007286 [Naegleria lovaniensis]